MPTRKPKPNSKPGRKPKFGAQLRRLREEAGLTTLELAELAGLSQSTVIVVEAGRRNELRASNRAKLLNVFKASDQENRDRLVRIAQTPPTTGNNDMPSNVLERSVLVAERLALAAERIANALEKTTKN